MQQTASFVLPPSAATVASRDFARDIVASLREQAPTAVVGVAIDVDASEATPLFLVSLLSGDGCSSRVIAATPDETGALRVWRLLARVLNRPRFVANVDGGYRPLEQTVGSLVTRPAQPRRKRRLPLRRRPSSRR